MMTRNDCQGPKRVAQTHTDRYGTGTLPGQKQDWTSAARCKKTTSSENYFTSVAAYCSVHLCRFLSIVGTLLRKSMSVPWGPAWPCLLIGLVRSEWGYTCRLKKDVEIA